VSDTAHGWVELVGSFRRPAVGDVVVVAVAPVSRHCSVMLLAGRCVLLRTAKLLPPDLAGACYDPGWIGAAYTSQGSI
jgi:hypothetical protein